MSLVALLVALATSAAAQSTTPGGMPPPPGMSLAEDAARRFPQPVRAGDLIGRVVQKMAESQDRVGTVRALVRSAEGGVLVVMDVGGFLGFGGHTIAVPVEAMVLVGDALQAAAFTPEQLRGFPAFTPAGARPVPPDTILRVGLAKPSH